MTALTLEVRLDGFTQPIGRLTRDANDGLTFAYTHHHLAHASPMPVSLSLPMTEDTYGDIKTRAFFSNLLQERDQPLREIMDRNNIALTDIAGLLFHMGADCAGAISILPQGHPPTKVPGNLATDYDLLSTAEINAIVQALHLRQPLPKKMLDPSPLAGVQSKISILALPGGQYLLPKPNSGAPTTHVLKVPDRQHMNDTKLERISLELSARCGITTVPAKELNFEGIPALITYRFDRAMNEAGHYIRLHQEDFAQALSLPPSLKYQRNGTEMRCFSAKSIAGLIVETAVPAINRLAILELTIFDLLIGNVDGHAKNHALLYSNTQRPNISPRYDILPTRLDSQFTDQLSYDIGAAQKFEHVDKNAFAQFMRDIGILTSPAQKRLLQDALEKIVPILAGYLDILQSEQQKSFADLVAANMRELLPKLGYPVPTPAITRDAYVVRGGGWHIS